MAHTASGLQKAGSRPDSSGKITCTRDNTRQVLLQFLSLLLQSDPAAVHYTTPAAIIGTLAANIPNNSEPNRVFQLAPLLILKIATTVVTADRDSRTSFFRAVWAQNLVSLCAALETPCRAPLMNRLVLPDPTDRRTSEQRAVVSGCQIHPTHCQWALFNAKFLHQYAAKRPSSTIQNTEYLTNFHTFPAVKRFRRTIFPPRVDYFSTKICWHLSSVGDRTKKSTLFFLRWQYFHLLLLLLLFSSRFGASSFCVLLHFCAAAPLQGPAIVPIPPGFTVKRSHCTGSRPSHRSLRTRKSTKLPLIQTEKYVFFSPAHY